MTPRPKHPKTDANHCIVSDYVNAVKAYGGYLLYALDTSKLGGESFDWLVWLGPLCIAVEVKAPGQAARLTDGEEAFIANCPGPKAIVETVDDLEEALRNWLPVVERMEE